MWWWWGGVGAWGMKSGREGGGTLPRRDRRDGGCGHSPNSFEKIQYNTNCKHFYSLSSSVSSTRREARPPPPPPSPPRRDGGLGRALNRDSGIHRFGQKVGLPAPPGARPFAGSNFRARAHSTPSARARARTRMGGIERTALTLTTSSSRSLTSGPRISLRSRRQRTIKSTPWNTIEASKGSACVHRAGQCHARL